MSEAKGKRPNKKLILSLWCLVLAAVVVINICVTNYALSWDKALGGYFGYLGGGELIQSEKYESLEALNAAQKELVLQIVGEGTVLLKNDNNALPLNAGDKVSVFGQTAQIWMTKEQISGTKDTVFLESLQNAGLEVNGELRKFYKQSKHTAWGIGANLGDGGVAGTWAIDEVPQSEYTDAVKQSYANYSDAAIVVFSRGGSEGGDLPRSMDRFGGTDDQHYMELTPDERDLLSAVGAAGFKKVIVVLHTCNAMQMDFVDVAEYGIDAVLWVSGTGQDGVEVLGKLITGEVNPSGRNVDTYVYDNLSAPAMQNFGDFRFTKNGEPVANNTSSTGGTYSYMNYGENIYVGYKYYETRYEDAVLGQGNAGNYDYASTVAYPFGYGLSYTSFTWSDFKASAPDRDGNMTLSVKVTNTGDRAGKEVVQFYFQAPYTDYDKQNKVEKAAVNLIEFGKTGLLAPNESETVEVTVNLYDMASYDANGKRTYIMDEGTYYLTAASDAHAAVNNILAAKGVDAGKLTGTGNKDMTATYTQDSFITRETAVTGNPITNQFDDCIMPGAAYLSRQDWSVLDKGGLTCADGTLDGLSNTTNAAGTVQTMEITDAIYSGLTTEGWAASGNPTTIDDPSWGAVQYGRQNGLILADMTGKDYDDPDWEKLLDQMTQAEQVELIGKAGWGTVAVASIGKVETSELDGPQGMIDYISGGKGYQFTNENVVGATWSKELSYREGDLCSQEFAMKGCSTWWCPAVNIHRTPFSGRNFEYYGEDGVFNGLMGTPWVRAAEVNGVNCVLKHFFLNDQETNRGANGRLATFATEQSMREIYLRAFQICVEEGGARGVMSSMSRVGWHPCPTFYNLNVGVLREEWGMLGTVITDAQSFNPREAEQGLAGGCDMVLTTAQTEYTKESLAAPGVQNMLRQASKNILYRIANSSVASVGIEKGFPIYILMLIAYNVLTVIYMAYATVEILLKLNPEQTILSKRGKTVMRAVLWTVGGVILAVLLVMFFTTWLPMLQFALQTAV